MRSCQVLLPAVPQDGSRPCPAAVVRVGSRPGNTRRRPRVPTHDEFRQADADQARRARPTEVTAVLRILALRVPQPYRSVRLHSRPHIDLLRVAGALCRP
ncbi:putative leader peptide [Streptomyces sp. NPDC020362]|uniref:putative leader peptide n=1 Tax=Streptomyces sp. NPDC020362 TaxID=3154486 RepID=UPI0033F2432F